MASEIRDVTPGLWIWSVEYPDWRPSVGWGPSVWSTCVESGGEVAVLDAMEPQSDEVWARLDAKPPRSRSSSSPTMSATWISWSSATAPALSAHGSSGRQNVPQTELEAVQPGTELPGGLVALHDGRGRMETPLWLPEQRAVVFADALTAPEGDLLVGGTPWHEERVLPALRALLDLPFETVIVSHGKPVHDRAAFERALERPPHSFSL